ncbi:MAG: radical SAM protein [Armatimonadota bacterium]
MEKIVHTREKYGIDKGAEEFPKMVVVSTTYVCNAKCPHCPYTEQNSDLRYKYRDALCISPDLFRKIADECGKFNSFIRITGGGEPLLHKDMVSLIEYARDKGARVWLNTNGSVFTQDVADRLLKCGIDFIEFSVDAADEETYNKVRPGLDFNKLVSNVKYTLSARNKLKSSTRIVVSIVNQKLIEDKEIDSIADFWLELGVDEAIKRKYLTWGSTTKLDTKDSADDTPYLIKEKGEPCPYPFHRLNVDTRGKVEVCGFDIAGRTNLGDVNKQTIQEVWKGPDFEYFRKMHAEGRGGEISLCSECPDWQYRSWNYNWERVLDTAEAHRKEAVDAG